MACFDPPIERQQPREVDNRETLRVGRGRDGGA